MPDPDEEKGAPAAPTVPVIALLQVGRGLRDMRVWSFSSERARDEAFAATPTYDGRSALVTGTAVGALLQLHLPDWLEIESL